MSMTDGKQLKYGHVRGGMRGFNVVVAATQAILANSGKFVKRTGTTTSTVTMAGNGDSDILGHIECAVLNSSVGNEVVWCINDLTAVFRLPLHGAGGTFYLYRLGKTCDILISNGIQYAALNSNDEGCVVVMGGDSENGVWVDLSLNPNRVFGAN